MFTGFFIWGPSAVWIIKLRTSLNHGAALFAHSALASPRAAIRCNRCRIKK